jgi:hypothetical protein
MRAFIIVDGQELSTLLARISARLPLEECRHTTCLDIVQVLDETIVMSSIVPAFKEQQIIAWVILAFVTEVDLLFGQFLADAFLMYATPAARATPDAAGLRWVKDPAAKIAVHAAGGDELPSHCCHTNRHNHKDGIKSFQKNPRVQIRTY